jgi:hypothetical protein
VPAADERGVEPSRERRRVVADADESPRVNRLALSFRLEGRHLLDAQRGIRETMGRCADQNLARDRGLF